MEIVMEKSIIITAISIKDKCFATTCISSQTDSYFDMLKSTTTRALRHGVSFNLASWIDFPHFIMLQGTVPLFHLLHGTALHYGILLHDTTSHYDINILHGTASHLTIYMKRRLLSTVYTWHYDTSSVERTRYEQKRR